MSDFSVLKTTYIKLRGKYKNFKGNYTRNQLLFILDAIFINASFILTSGIFISGYIVFLGGSDFLTGIINSSVNWASIAALFSFLVFERLKKRKKLLITMVAASRLLLSSVIFIPLISHNNTVVLFTVSAMIIAGNLLWGIYTIGWIVWFMGVSPKETRNEYIYTRTLFLRISFTSVTIILGFVLDWFHKSYAGFLIVFCVSLLLAVFDIIVLCGIEEPEDKGERLMKKFDPAVFWSPIKNAGYRMFLVFIFLYYVVLTMSSSYTPLYLIKYLKFDYAFISMINVIMYITMIIFTQFWARIEKIKGLSFVFGVSALFAVAEFLIFGFLVSERYYLLFFSSIIAGIGNGGFNVCIVNYRYNLMPDIYKTVYEGWFAAVFGLSTFIAPLIGGMLIQNLPEINGSLFRHGNFQFLYIISFVLALNIIIFFFFGRGSYKIGCRELPNVEA